MQVKDINDLEKIIKLCRKTGVESIKIDNIELKLGDQPEKQLLATPAKKTINTSTYAPGGITEDSKIEIPEQLTEDQLMMWSTGSDQQ
jgi:hypothetical protein